MRWQVEYFDGRVWDQAEVFDSEADAKAMARAMQAESLEPVRVTEFPCQNCGGTGEVWDDVTSAGYEHTTWHDTCSECGGAG